MSYCNLATRMRECANDPGNTDGDDSVNTKIYQEISSFWLLVATLFNHIEILGCNTVFFISKRKYFSKSLFIESINLSLFG